ncbi:hypothetical protein HMN09_01290800 [Mycena chlorophos]|uniref:F-box domain-containing protein n=1 Tax=Mycena chlorophos TaxID=658473 RepID=A0A8H6VUA2_MYCCL|nr:hypothetical protein HMN09_01290800 [Mycena chlorophos]
MQLEILPPEVLDEVASLIPRSADVARLGLTNRSMHSLAQPHLFRHIGISFSSVPLLASALKADPAAAGMCRSLHLTPLGGDEEPDYNEVNDALVFIFDSFAKHGGLLAVRWYCFSTTDYGFRELVWEAIGQNHKSLRVLEVLEMYAMASREQEDWLSVTRPFYPNLRVLRINLPRAHDWPGEEFQKMLTSNCPMLEELVLKMPSYYSPVGLDLASNTHPHLRVFEIAAQPDNPYTKRADFLTRHPHIERLTLLSQFMRPPDEEKSSLRAHFNLEDMASYALTPYGRDIVHLRLLDVPYLSEVLTRGAIHSLARTLRCLELFRQDFRSFEDLLEHIGPVLAEMIWLEEFAVGGMNVSPGWGWPAWEERHLRGLLRALSQFSTISLRALRFFSYSGTGAPLSSDFLEDLGAVPPRLQYLCWDVTEAGRMVYLVDGRRARLLEPGCVPWVRSRTDWTGESVLDHLA